MYRKGSSKTHEEILEHSDLNHSYQPASYTGHSKETALLKVLGNIAESMKLLIMPDLFAAFEVIDYSRPLKHLEFSNYWMYTKLIGEII